MRVKASIEHQTSPHRRSSHRCSPLCFGQGLELVRLLPAAISVQTELLLLLSHGCLTGMLHGHGRIAIVQNATGLRAEPCTSLLKPTLKHAAAEVETQLLALQASIVTCCSTFCLISATSGIPLNARSHERSNSSQYMLFEVVGLVSRAHNILELSRGRACGSPEIANTTRATATSLQNGGCQPVQNCSALGRQRKEEMPQSLCCDMRLLLT